MSMPDAMDEQPAPPKPMPHQLSTPAPSSQARPRLDVDDEDSGPLISGKLLTVASIVAVLGVIVGAWLLLGGRGSSGSNRAAIHGEVTLDGKPVEIGSIHFSSLDPKTGAVAVPTATIENGKYSIPLELGPSIGMCKVAIYVRKKTGQQNPKFMGMPGEVEDEIVEGAAERFNVKSDLTFDVKAGSNTANFTVSAR